MDNELSSLDKISFKEERKTMSKLYIFMDTEHDTGGRSVKFISEDRDKVITFIGNYAIDSKNEGSTCYYEIVEVGLDVEL